MLYQKGHKGEPFDVGGEGKGVISNQVITQAGINMKEDIAKFAIAMLPDSLVLLK